MKLFFAALLLGGVLYAAGACALEIEGVTLEDKIALSGENTALLLNGAGVRHKLVFIKLYVCALYLEHRNGDAEAIYADAGAKRILMHTLYDELTGSELVASLNHALAANLVPHELALLEKRMRDLNQALSSIKAIKKGSVIDIDYIPGAGTRIALDGETRLTIPGEDFFRALLHVWIGAKPVDGRLRDALLGAAPRRLF